MSRIVEKLQEKIANLAIGASTLRNQGPPGMIASARLFLSRLDLNASIDAFKKQKYQKYLNKQTLKLMEFFPEGGCNNFGAARKSLNIFFRDIFDNRIILKHFKIKQTHILYKQLELPLDSYTIRGLLLYSNESKQFWQSIKSLTPKNNQHFQKLAHELATLKKINRNELDILLWRNIDIDTEIHERKSN